MAVRAQFENNNDIGVFAKLTSAYCLVPVGGSENFYRFVCFGDLFLFPQWNYVCRMFTHVARRKKLMPFV
jgi:hypothetical protein